MKKKELNFVLATNRYIHGGTKEACIKVREFLRFSYHSGRFRHTSRSCCVAEQEFLDAIQVLLVFAFQQEDTIPETWYCDSDCHRVSDLLCPGEFGIGKDSKALCPYFQDDTIPETWYCDSDCHRVSDLLCPGELGIDKDSKALCPYFQDEAFI